VDYRNTFAYKLLQKFESMRERVAHYVAVIDECPIPAFITSRDGKELYYVNAAYRELFGKDEAQLQEDEWMKLIHPDDRAKAATVWQEYIKNPVNNVPMIHTLRYITRNGVLPASTKVTAIPGNGIVGYIVCATGCSASSIRDLQPVSTPSI
jgi:PAS domain S-box-containing protein